MKSAHRLAAPLPSNFLGKQIKLQPLYEKLLTELPEPKLLWKHFMTCLQTPRPSSKLEKIQSQIAETAKIIGVEYTQDKIGNIVLRKNATSGFEKSSKVCLQCHMDMVCTKNDEIKHDFEKDGIKAYIENKEWLKAEGTTLGADDGIGIAAGLALMEDPILEKLGHGVLELLITVDEETTMAGATELAEYPFVQSTQLINVDSEEKDKVCVGCAGGFRKDIDFNQLQYENLENTSEYVAIEIVVNDLNGGHTGIQIHLGRANAIQCMARILNELLVEKFSSSSDGVRIYECIGGNACNAIPRKCSCTIVVAKKEVSNIKKVIQGYWDEIIMNEYKDIEPTMNITIRDGVELPSNGKVVDKTGSESIVTMMLSLPHGVLRMSPTVANTVHTSIAFSMMNWNHENGQVRLQLMGRSFSMSEMVETNKKLDALVRMHNGRKDHNICVASEMLESFPGWDPNTNSVLLEETLQAYKTLHSDKAPEVYAVHAGLECGLIKNRYPKMDCISIGPYIDGAHSTDEKLELASVLPFYEWLREIVARIFHHHKTN